MNAGKPVTLSLGEVLWDMLPDGKALGGSPTNAAWHAAQLGAEAHVATAVGDDGLGREILARLGDMRLDLAAVVVLPDRPTSTVDARLDADGNATYVIHEGVAWDYLPATRAILDVAARADGINFGSLAQRHAIGRETTRAVLDAANPGSVRVFDINLRPPFVFAEVLDAGLRRSTVVKMNEDELPVLAAALGWRERGDEAALRLLAEYPGLAHVVVTRAGAGIRWRGRDCLVERRPAGDVRVVDTIGAGDSVTATTMMGLLKGWDAERIVETALAVASFVCGCRGGTPELPAELKEKFR